MSKERSGDGEKVDSTSAPLYIATTVYMYAATGSGAATGPEDAEIDIALNFRSWRETKTCASTFGLASLWRSRCVDGLWGMHRRLQLK